jgi:hypothetical protein
MSQFAFLQAEFPDIFAHATRAENLANFRSSRRRIRRPHSKERFARRAEDLAFQRLFAFRPMRLTARFDRRPALRFGVIALAARSRACENPHEYALFARP